MKFIPGHKGIANKAAIFVTVITMPLLVGLISSKQKRCCYEIPGSPPWYPSNAKELNLTNHYSPGDEETKKTFHKGLLHLFAKQDGALGGSPHLVNG